MRATPIPATPDESFLSFPVDKGPVVIGRSASATARILNPTISRVHATITRVDGDLTIEDHDSRFGTFVNGVRVRVVRLVPGDRVQFGAARAYKVERDGLRLDDAAEGLRLSLHDLAVSGSRDAVPGFWRQFSGESGRPDRTLVEGIEFDIESESFVGILGPSGVGKSTLLNCLASHVTPSRGRILFDGGRDVDHERDAFRAILGYVPQADIVFMSLTARENLTFAARMRLGAEPGTDQREAVEQALSRVGLREPADRRAGRLSGGERKRLSVAIELLRRPRLLLLDEPTSGLDPASEAHLMEQLRQLARQGTTVVCTTHLMDNLHLFDSLLVLGRKDGVGRVAYRGDPAGLLARFGCRGFADLYEILEAGRFDPERPVRDSAAAAPAAPGERDLEPTPSRSSESGSHPSSARSTEPPGIAELAARLQADPGWRQLPIVMERALKQIFRDRVLVLAMVAQPVALGLFVALTQYDALKPFPIFFFAVVIAIWLGLNNSVRDLIRERRHYVRDRLAGLRPFAYLGAKTLVHCTLGLAQLFILLFVLRAGCGLLLERQVNQDLSAAPLAYLTFVLLLSYLGGVGLGFLASILVRTEEAAVAVLPLLIIPQLLISAVATGVQYEPYTKARPFRPVVVTLTRHEGMSAPAVCVDLLSFACLSRPAALAAEAPSSRDFGSASWLGDLCHLVLLLLVTWALVILAFQRSEPRWMRWMEL